MPQRTVLNGELAEASIGGVAFVHLFDWKVTIETETINAAGYGDTWQYPVPVISGWTFTARGYVAVGVPAQYLHDAWHASGSTPYFTVTGWKDLVGPGGSTMKIFEGLGLPTKGQLEVPMALAEQEIVFKGYGPPTTGVS